MKVTQDLTYTVVKPDGSPFFWNEFCEGWAHAPIRLRRETDARHAVGFLTAKFGAAAWVADMAPAVRSAGRERIPTFVDELDARLALWIAESQMADEEA
jgi:hypothetical protein